MTIASASSPWALHGGWTRMVDTPSGPLRVHGLGGGAPVILVHGWGMGAAAFAWQAPLARAGLSLIAPDLPGFAGTGPAGDRAGLDAYRTAVIALADALSLASPALVGWSMGASIAWKAAAAAPGRFRALASIDMSPRPSTGQDWEAGLAGGYSAQDCARAVEGMLRDWPAMCGAFLPRVTQSADPRAAAVLAGLAAIADPGSAARAWESLALADLRADVAALDLPLLAIHGRSSALYPVATAAALKALNPRVETLLVDGAGHAPHIEAPDIVNPALVRFVQAAGETHTSTA